MTKEILTKENVKQDLMKIVKQRRVNNIEWRLCSVVIWVGIAGIFLVFRVIWAGILTLVPAGYHIVRLIIELRENKASQEMVRKAINRGDFSVSLQKLSHTGYEILYEVKAYEYFGNSLDRNRAREVEFYYFYSGLSWRVPAVEYYSWSKTFRTGSIEYTSVPGNEFYLIALQEDHEISFIYNTKMFQLDDEFSEPA